MRTTTCSLDGPRRGAVLDHVSRWTRRAVAAGICAPDGRGAGLSLLVLSANDKHFFRRRRRATRPKKKKKKNPVHRPAAPNRGQLQLDPSVFKDAAATLHFSAALVWPIQRWAAAPTSRPTCPPSGQPRQREVSRLGLDLSGSRISEGLRLQIIRSRTAGPGAVLRKRLGTQVNGTYYFSYSPGVPYHHASTGLAYGPSIG